VLSWRRGLSRLSWRSWPRCWMRPPAASCVATSQQWPSEQDGWLVVFFCMPSKLLILLCTLLWGCTRLVLACGAGECI
jgi:hypothetical protein